MMIARRDWLWDRNTPLSKVKAILLNPKDKLFLSYSALLLSRNNTPKEIFKTYLNTLDFARNWPRIKRQMRKDSWNNPRIEFWQAIYEKLIQKYKQKGVEIPREPGPIKIQDEFCKSIAEKIRAIRKNKGLTQDELAEKLKVSQQIISRIEKGKENISMLTLKKIADALEAKIYLEIR